MRGLVNEQYWVRHASKGTLWRARPGGVQRTGVRGGLMAHVVYKQL